MYGSMLWYSVIRICAYTVLLYSFPAGWETTSCFGVYIGEKFLDFLVMSQCKYEVMLDIH